MKKKLIILGMIVSMLSFTACGNQNADIAEVSEVETEAVNVADTYISTIEQVVAQGMTEQYVKQDASLEPVFTNWEKGSEDLGKITGIIDHTVNVDGDSVIVTTKVTGDIIAPDGKNRTADVELIYNKGDYAITSLSVNVKYTFGELMEKAGLNTLLGMGTVFTILILISLIISLFKFIPKIQAAFTKKEEKAPEAKKVESAPAQVEEVVDEEDDSEIVAVISAAIAAFEAEMGDGCADGVVIRSIRKRR